MSSNNLATNADTCQSIYRTLLTCGGNTTYVRELFETVQCDEYANFARVREDHANRIGRERLNRVLAFEETAQDEKIVAQSCLHYADIHRAHMVKALTWPNWIMYHTVDRAESVMRRIFAGNA